MFMFGWEKKLIDRMDRNDARVLELARKRAKETGIPLIEIDVSNMSPQELKGAVETLRQIRSQEGKIKV